MTQKWRVNEPEFMDGDDAFGHRRQCGCSRPEPAGHQLPARRPENRAEEWDTDARLRPSVYAQIFVSVCEYLQWTDRDRNSKSRNATMEKVSRVHIFYLRHLKACRTVSLKCKYWTLQRHLSSILGVIRLKYIITIVQIWITIDYQDDPNKLVNKLYQNDGKSLDYRLKKFGGRTW